MFEIYQRGTLENNLVLCAFSNPLSLCYILILGSIVVSIPACHAGDQGSIPCRGEVLKRNAI